MRKELKYIFCISDDEGCVVKEFPNRECREAYINYLKVLPVNEENEWVIEARRATCKPGDQYILNNQGSIFYNAKKMPKKVI